MHISIDSALRLITFREKEKQKMELYNSIDKQVCETLATVAFSQLKHFTHNSMSCVITLEGMKYTLDRLGQGTCYYKMEDGNVLRISKRWSSSNVSELNTDERVCDNFKIITNAGNNAFLIDGDVYCGGVSEGYTVTKLKQEVACFKMWEAINSLIEMLGEKNSEISKLKDDLVSLKEEKDMYLKRVQVLDRKINAVKKPTDVFKPVRRREQK